MARALRPLHAPIIVVLTPILIIEAAITPTTMLGVDPTPPPAPTEAASPPPVDATVEPLPSRKVEQASEPTAGRVELIDQRTIDSRTFASGWPMRSEHPMGEIYSRYAER